MRRTPLWLVASLGLVCIASVTNAAELKVMSAPNLLRVGTAENIFVECQDCNPNTQMVVKISAWNYPTKSSELNHTTVTLDKGNKHQALGQLLIPPGTFDKNPNAKQYVYLRAEFPTYTLEKVVLVSFQAGYLFIQTDKTLYTPNSIVNFRIFGLTPGMKPILKDEASGNPVTILVEMVAPDGIVIPLDSFSLKSGIHKGTYNLGEMASVGQWKVVSRFQSNPQLTYSAEFEVKKYVLPSFEVKLTPVSSFYYFDTPSFDVDIKATYLFGKEVFGMAYIVFGYMDGDNKKAFPDSLQRVEIIEGSGQATLLKQHILKTYPDITKLVGGSLFVTATVYTSSGSEMVEAELRNLKIVTSPYSINFDKTPKYFKPGMSFDVTVSVTDPNGTPARDIPVKLDGQDIPSKTRDNGRATLTVNTKATDKSLSITARTQAVNLPEKRQTSKTMVAVPHQSQSQNYIHIAMTTAEVKLGNDLRLNLNLNSQVSKFEITYLILSRGQLVEFGRQTADGQRSIVLPIPVKKTMLPSFRLIVYYHPNPNEVVSDSVWVDVDDSCMGTLKLEPRNNVLSYEPRRPFPLRISGDPGATVGLVAVDKGVYVLNKKHILTQKKVWNIVEKADTGCTPGGGQNSMGVFFDAGLMFHTDTASGTPYRQAVKCPSPSTRKRRASTLHDARTTLVKKYNTTLERECCQDGMKGTPLSYTCAQRKRYITDGKACEDAFLFCCEELEKQREDLKQDNLILARSEEDNSFMDSSEITSRTKFPESWLWDTITLPDCPRNAKCDGLHCCSHDMVIPLKDSITTWVFTGISLSENNGICVGKSLEVIAYKQFFIDLRLPYSAVVGEQIEIRAVLHNYIGDSVIVLVELYENPDICSSASKHSKFAQKVEVAASDTRAVSFTVIPMKEGKLKIEVKAIVKDSWHGDGVIKHLLVVPKGVLKKERYDVTLDPKGGTQEQTVNSTVPKINIVPGTPSSTKVFVTGREQVGVLIESVIGASAMGKLIVLPYGCGEQTMFFMTKTVIATVYLDKTRQWEDVGVERRDQALQHIKAGVINEMQYAKPGGSFAVWKWEKSSVWLTTYVVKVFSMASSLVTIKDSAICDAVRFLILSAQLPDGMFKETGPIYHRGYTGDVLGRESDASMTAFCVIALQESQRICNSLVNSLPGAIDKSLAYLEKRLPSLTNPYAVAITSYALANANKLNKDILYKFASPDKTHWKSPLGHVYTLEATAYALLALVKAELLEDARPIVRWLKQHQKPEGDYGSTQATIMVYQAVSEYWTVAKEPSYNLDVELKVPGRAAPYNYRITHDNHYTTRTTNKFDINENVKVTARGTGEATLTLVTEYYAVPKETVSDCTKFNLSVGLTLDKVDEAEGDIYKLKMLFFYKDDTEDARMSILDVTLPTGFVYMNADLDSLAEGHAPVISKWEDDKKLSERGSIIIYLKKVSHDNIEEVTFRMRQAHKVGVLQPASVSLYEYYNDETKCVKYYHPQRKDGQIMRRCREGQTECLCAEENCSMQKKGKIDNRERIDKACESTQSVKIDYVYQVVLEEVQYGSFDIYGMRIERVIKDGSYDKNALGNLRNFLSFPHCRESLNLQKNKGYLIMGTADDTLPDKSTQYSYWLGERTWIEFNPRGPECQKDENRQTCLDMRALIFLFETSGCIAK